MKCECCGKFKAEIKDFRFYSEESISMYVCKYCANLNDVYFDKVLNSDGKLNPKVLLNI